MHATKPYNKAVAITKSDTVDFSIPGGLAGPAYSHAIYVGGAGVVAVVLEDGAVVNFTCVAGQVLPVKARRVNSTNTTATLMVALYYL